MRGLRRFLFRRLVAREVRQGEHAYRITQMYREIRAACEREFPEDNSPTLDAFLRECFEVTQRTTPHA